MPVYLEIGLVTKTKTEIQIFFLSQLNHCFFLFYLQRTQRLPREMAPVKPSAFAAELIARLEKLKREQDTLSSLEERLQQIQEVGIQQNYLVWL